METNKRYILEIIMESIFDRRVKVANAMIQFGGSFIVNIGHALLCADQENTRKIHDAFQEYWKEYEALAGCVVNEL